MTARITLADGRALEVERCLWLETKDKEGKWKARWIVQFRRGKKAVLLPQEALKDAKRMDETA